MDVARQLSKKVGNKAIVFELTGVTGGTWLVGSDEEVSRLRMDVLDFNIFVSGRFSYDEGIAQAELTGDTEFLKAILKDLLILF